MREGKRVLHVTEKLQAAGIESFIMNMYRNIDKDKVQFDFLVTRDEKEYYDDEINGYGGKKYTIDVNKRIHVFFRVLIESLLIFIFLKKNPYQIIHVHSTTPIRVVYLIAAKFANVETRIYHSHSAEIIDKGKVKKKMYNMFKKLFPYSATHFFTCSEAAGKWMYPEHTLRNENYSVIYNGIDVDRFGFDGSIRNKYRKKLGLGNKFVIGHTGRFLSQKNHTFILDVYKEFHIKYPSSELILIGEGPLLNEMKEKVNLLGLENNVRFLGVRSDVSSLLQALDFYIMPSLYEGLPVAAIEAQCSGLDCLFSDNITDEVKINSNVKFLNLNDDLIYWKDNIIKTEFDRSIGKQNVIASGYSIKNAASKLQNYYLFRES